MNDKLFKTIQTHAGPLEVYIDSMDGLEDAPPSLNVGTYAERDAEATFGLWQEMKKEILHQDLESIFDLFAENATTSSSLSFR